MKPIKITNVSNSNLFDLYKIEQNFWSNKNHEVSFDIFKEWFEDAKGYNNPVSTYIETTDGYSAGIFISGVSDTEICGEIKAHEFINIFNLLEKYIK